MRLTVSTEMDHAGLAEKGGHSAQESFTKAIDRDTDVARRVALEAALRAHCRRDTEAMKALARRLCA